MVVWNFQYNCWSFLLYKRQPTWGDSIDVEAPPYSLAPPVVYDSIDKSKHHLQLRCCCVSKHLELPLVNLLCRD